MYISDETVGQIYKIIVYVLSSICLVAIFLSTLIIFAILRYRRLKTRTNVHILHISFLNVLYSTCTIVLFLIGTREQMIIIVLNSIGVLQSVFAFCLIQDSLSSLCNPNEKSCYQRYYKYIHVVVYLFFTLECISALLMEIYEYFFVNQVIQCAIFFLYVSMLVAFAIVLISVKDMKNILHTHHGYAVGIVPFLLFLTHAIYYLITFVIDLHLKIQLLLFWVYVVWLAHPIINVYRLQTLDKYFKMAFKKCLGKTNSYSQTELSELGQKEPSEQTNQFLGIPQIAIISIEGFS